MNTNSMRSITGLRGAAVLCVGLMAVLLTACASGPSPSGTAPDPSHTSAAPVESPTPTSTATPDEDAANPADWTVRDSGIGPIELGARFEEARAEVPTWTVQDACSWTAFWNDPDGAVTAYFAEDSAARDGVTTIDVAALTEAVAPEDAPRTAEGIGLGSTRDQVRAAYPDAVEQAATIGDAMLLRTGAQGTIFFTFQAGSDVVSAITVTSRDEPPYEVCG